MRSVPETVQDQQETVRAQVFARDRREVPVRHLQCSISSQTIFKVSHDQAFDDEAVRVQGVQEEVQAQEVVGEALQSRQARHHQERGAAVRLLYRGVHHQN